LFQLTVTRRSPDWSTTTLDTPGPQVDILSSGCTDPHGRQIPENGRGGEDEDEKAVRQKDAAAATVSHWNIRKDSRSVYKKMGQTR